MNNKKEIFDVIDEVADITNNLENKIKYEDLEFIKYGHIQLAEKYVKDKKLRNKLMEKLEMKINIFKEREDYIFNKGKHDGLNEEKTNIARKMLSDNINQKTISKYTGLNKKQIQNIKYKVD